MLRILWVTFRTGTPTMMRFRTPLLAAGILATAAPAPAPAQDADSLTLERALQTTEPSSVVRLQLLDERFLTGELVGFGPDGIEVSTSSGAARVSRGDVARYWERGRAVRGGAVTLGLVGAALGAAMGALLASTCETCSADHSTVDGAFQGGLVVGGVGAAVGAVLGAAIPRWRLRWESEAPDRDGAPVLVAAVPGAAVPGASSDAGAARGIGEMSLQLVGGHGRVAVDPSLSDLFASREGPMIGVLAGLSFRSGRFGLGPELLYMRGGPDVTAVTGLVHFDLAPGDARFAPHLLTGAGGYRWGDELLLTVPLGLGVSFGAERRWRAEARWHELVHHGSIERPSLLTISAGRRLAW